MKHNLTIPHTTSTPPPTSITIHPLHLHLSLLTSLRHNISLASARLTSRSNHRSGSSPPLAIATTIRPTFFPLRHIQATAPYATTIPSTCPSPVTIHPTTQAAANTIAKKLNVLIPIIILIHSTLSFHGISPVFNHLSRSEANSRSSLVNGEHFRERTHFKQFSRIFHSLSSIEGGGGVGDVLGTPLTELLQTSKIPYTTTTRRAITNNPTITQPIDSLIPHLLPVLLQHVPLHPVRLIA